MRVRLVRPNPTTHLSLRSFRRRRQDLGTKAVPEAAPEPLQTSQPDGTLALPSFTEFFGLGEASASAFSFRPPLSPPPPPLPPLPPSPSLSPPASPITISSPSVAPLEETREAEAKPSSPRKDAPSTGDSHLPEGPGAVAAVETPVLAPSPPSTAQFPLPSFPSPEVERPQQAVAQLQGLSSSVFGSEEPHTERLTYAQAVTSAQLAAHDAQAEREYQCLLESMRDYINATEALRVWEGQMEWIMRCEEWFLVEVEEIAMDPRR